MENTRRKPDYPLLTAIGVLIPIGLVMVYSASFVDAYTNRDGPLYYVWRQFGAAIIGIVAMLVTIRLDYRFWRRYSLHLIGGTILLLALTLVLPASITEVNGARSWIRIGPFSMQPSEIAKLAMIVYFADWLSRRGEKVGNVTLGLLPFATVLGIICGLVIIGHDLGTTVVLAMIGVTIYFVAGANLLHILGATAISGAFFVGMIQVAAYRQERIAAWLDPFAYYLGAGYQPVHSLYALGSGGLFGVGLGQARQKFLWLPQAHTDAIFSILGEEFGFLGTMFVAGCFLMIAYRGIRIAGRSPDPFAALMATGLTAWLVFQAMINMAVVTTLVPFTGLTLPFISYGGTSLVMSMVAAGILLNISKHTVDLPRVEPNDTIPTQRRARTPVTNNLAVWWRNRRPRVPSTSNRRRTYRRI
ncbi:MAG: putative lipid II flippase FtsW [Roseiflexaceae bacterium]|nr:putative lipid II flippase FtsW [Roseiflexaceae bacterium]